MKTENHLSDAEIQQYALGEARSDHATRAHIANCSHCSPHVQFYRAIARNVSSSPAEAFDFELAPLVLAKLPTRKPRHAPEWVFVVCVSTIGIIAGIGLFWYLNAELPSKILSNGGAAIYGATLICGLLFSFLTTNLQREYIHKIQQLTGPGSLQQYPGAAV